MKVLILSDKYSPLPFRVQERLTEVGVESMCIRDLNDILSLLKEYQDLNTLLNQFTTYWFWKHPTIVFDLADENRSVQRQLSTEILTLLDYIVMNSDPSLRGGIKSTNKLNVLRTADRLGILVPETYFVSNKNGVKILTECKRELITKPMSEPMFFRANSKTFGQYTSLINGQNVSKIADFQFPSMVQQYIKPLYTIRSIYLLGKFYSVGQISQTNDQVVDSRYYGLHSDKYKFFGCDIPKNLKSKLAKLAHLLNFNFCSFDIIFCDKKEYYLLELNPSGQVEKIFEMLDIDASKIIADSIHNLKS